MADNADLANDYTEQFLAHALAATVSKTGQVTGGSLLCEDCDAVIPQARREALAFCTTCVDCQSLREVSA